MNYGVSIAIITNRTRRFRAKLIGLLRTKVFLVIVKSTRLPRGAHYVRYRKPARQKGFTIIEVLITIAVVSVAFLGTIAALAFGMTASRDTSLHTVALNYNRRMIELVYGGGFIKTPPGSSDPIALDVPASINESINSSKWRQLYYLPARPDGIANPFPTDKWFELSDWFAPRPSVQYDYPEAQKFRLQEEKFQTNMTVQNNQLIETPTDAQDVKSNVYRLVVQTRWREKVGTKSAGSELNRWRSVRTDAVVIP